MQVENLSYFQCPCEGYNQQQVNGLVGDPLVKVQVAEVLGGLDTQGNFVIVENHPLGRVFFIPEIIHRSMRNNMRKTSQSDEQRYNNLDLR